MRIAMTGNPNSGKTTMYNALTGRSEHVGNWAGVTVDKKEHPVKKNYYEGFGLAFILFMHWVSPLWFYLLYIDSDIVTAFQALFSARNASVCSAACCSRFPSSR